MRRFTTQSTQHHPPPLEILSDRPKWNSFLVILTVELQEKIDWFLKKNIV